MELFHLLGTIKARKKVSKNYKEQAMHIYSMYNLNSNVYLQYFSTIFCVTKYSKNDTLV